MSSKRDFVCSIGSAVVYVKIPFLGYPDSYLRHTAQIKCEWGLICVFHGIFMAFFFFLFVIFSYIFYFSSPIKKAVGKTQDTTPYPERAAFWKKKLLCM